MKEPEAISFTHGELMSYLPSGWGLAREDDLGGFNEAKRRWRVEVRDAADQTWPVDVKSAAAGELGRLEALKRAIDHVYREALG